MEGEASSLKKLTESLEGRTQALTDQLAKQRSDFAQRLFEAQQEVNQVCPLQAGVGMQGFERLIK